MGSDGGGKSFGDGDERLVQIGTSEEERERGGANGE